MEKQTETTTALILTTPPPLMMSANTFKVFYKEYSKFGTGVGDFSTGRSGLVEPT